MMLGLGIGIFVAERAMQIVTGSTAAVTCTASGGVAMQAKGTSAATSSATSTAFGGPTDLPNLIAYADASFSADITTSSTPVTNSVTTQANHAGSGGSAWNRTDGGSSTRRPVYDGVNKISYNGTSNWLQTAAAAISEPYTVLAKIRCDAANTAYIYDGRTLNTRILYAKSATNNDVWAYAGTNLAGAVNSLPITTPAVVGAEYNSGTAGKLISQGKAMVNGTIGAASSNGETVGAAPGGTSFAKLDEYWRVLYGAALSDNQIYYLINYMS